MATESQTMTPNQQFIRSLLVNPPDPNKEDQTMKKINGAPSHYMIVSQDDFGRPIVHKRIVTNGDHIPQHVHQIEVGQFLVPSDIGEAYRFAFLEHFLGDLTYWVEFIPQQEGYVIPNNASLAFADEETITVIHVEEYPGWGGVCKAAGLVLIPHLKLAKRLKEIARVSRYYRHFNSHEVTVGVFDAESDEVEHYDGQTVIRPSFFLKMARNNRDRRYLKAHGKSGSFRLLTTSGLIKGDFILAESDDAIDYDVLTSSDNLKSEIRFSNEEDIWCTFFLHHDHHAPVTDIQSLSWLGEHVFPVDKMEKTLKADARQVLVDVMEGNFPSFMTDSSDDGEYDPDDAGSITNMRNQYERWIDAGLELNQSAYFIRTIGQAYLSKMRKGMHFPIPQAVYVHVTTHEVLNMAGYLTDDYRDVVFYHHDTGRLSLPGDLFKEVFANHGGWDLDDSVRVLIRNFGSDGIKALLLRSPNAWGEYSILDVDMASISDVLYNTEDGIPEIGMTVAEFKDTVHPIQKVDEHVQYIGMPEGGLTMNEEYDYNFASQVVEALAEAPNIGSWANSQMVYYSSVGTYRRQQLAHTEDIVDTLTQSVNPDGFKAVAQDIHKTWRAVQTHGIIEEYFVKQDRRVPQRYLKDTETFRGHLSELNVAHKFVLNNFDKALTEISNKQRNPISELLDIEVTEKSMDRAKQAELWFRKLADSAPKGKKLVFRDTDAPFFDGASQMLLQRRDRDFWFKANRMSVKTLVSSKDTFDLIVAMYQYSEKLRVQYGRTNGIDRFLFPPSPEGEPSVMDVLIAAYKVAK
jgi:hypothetical protein